MTTAYLNKNAWAEEEFPAKAWPPSQDYIGVQCMSGARQWTYTDFNWSEVLPACIIQSKKVVVTAVLHFKVSGTSGISSKLIELKNTGSVWDENLTWQTRIEPSGTATGITTNQPSGSGWYNTDVTILVNDWLTGKGGSGWLWRYANEATNCNSGQTYFFFRDRISGDKAYVEIEY